MERPVQLVDYFPHAFACDCGIPHLVEQVDAWKPIRCPGCGKLHGPFDLSSKQPKSAVSHGLTIDQADSPTEVSTIPTLPTTCGPESLSHPAAPHSAGGYIGMIVGVVVYFIASVLFPAKSRFWSDSAPRFLILAAIAFGVAMAVALAIHIASKNPIQAVGDTPHARKNPR